MTAQINKIYKKKKSLKQQLKENTDCLTKKICFLCKVVLYYKIKHVINTQKVKWNKTHIQKFEILKSEQQKYSNPNGRIVN